MASHCPALLHLTCPACGLHLVYPHGAAADARGRRRQGAKDFLGGMGLGMLSGQLADLKLGELLDTPPPGLDEAVAIAKVRPPALSRMALVDP